MPKETKKFINPLLRPSQQEVEPKQESAPKQERSVAATTVQASRTEPPRQAVEQEERSEPTPPNLPRQQASEPEAHTIPAHENPARPRTTKAPTVAEPERTSRQENDTPERVSNHVQTYEPQAETLRARPNQTLVRSEAPPPYISHVSARSGVESTVTDYEESSELQDLLETDADTDMDMEGDEDANDDLAYEPQVDFTTTTTKARRKKGEQAFEKTHVRFTVWVDKNLKQSFEDIASQRDKPKTTLLNEAIADLVRKYEAH